MSLSEDKNSFGDLYLFGNIVQETLGIRPAETGVRDGFSVDAFADPLAAFLKIAFNHESLDHPVDLPVGVPVVQDFPCNADLFKVFLVGIAVIGVNDAGGIEKLTFLIHADEPPNILKMVIRIVDAVLVDGSAKHAVGQRVPVCFYLKSAVNEIMGMLGCIDGIKELCINKLYISAGSIV